MFNHPDISDVIRRQHGDRMIESAMRRRRVFGRPRGTTAGAMAAVVALPQRVDRAAAHDSRVA
jgi:hypothetical protein